MAMAGPGWWWGWALAAVAAAVEATVEPTPEGAESVHVSEDRTVRRVLLLVVLPTTALLGFLGVRAYYPNLDVEEKVKQLRDKVKKKKKDAPLKPWWEGGCLGDDGAAPADAAHRLELLDSYRNEFMGGGGSGTSFNSSAAAMPDLFTGDAAGAAHGKKAGKKPPPRKLWGGDEVDEEAPEAPPMPPVAMTSVTSEVDAEAPAGPAVPGREEMLGRLEQQEGGKRAWLESLANEDWFSLASERDAERRKLVGKERRGVQLAEAEGRRGIEGAQSEGMEALTTEWWDVYQHVVGRSLLVEKEGDVRYALVYEEKAGRRDLEADEQVMRIYVATRPGREATEAAEDRGRIDVEEAEAAARAELATLLARFGVSAFELAARHGLAAAEGSAAVQLFSGHVAVCEAFGRAGYTLSEIIEATVLTEYAGRLGWLELEASQRRHLCHEERHAMKRLNLRQMRVVVDGAVVRASADRKSKLIATLPFGTVVDVLEVNPAGRALLVHPEGWVSVQSQAGLAILEEVPRGGDDDARLSELDQASPASATSASLKQGAKSLIMSPRALFRSGSPADASNSPNEGRLRKAFGLARTPKASPKHKPKRTGSILSAASIPPADAAARRSQRSDSEPPSETISLGEPLMSGPPAAQVVSPASSHLAPASPMISRDATLTPPADLPLVKRPSSAQGNGDDALPFADMDDGWGGAEDSVLPIQPTVSTDELAGGGEAVGSAVFDVVHALSEAEQKEKEKKKESAAARRGGSQTPSIASSAPSSALLEDFREIVLTKSSATQKLGICFAKGSRLVLSSCMAGSAAATNGLDAVVGHRLVKVNGHAVIDKASIAPYGKETTLHLVFSKDPDPGWNAQAKTWAPSKTQQLTDKMATTAFSGFRGLRKAAAEAKKAAVTAAKDAQRAAKDLQATSAAPSPSAEQVAPAPPPEAAAPRPPFGTRKGKAD
eukprot:TRINITY_DN24678_c0_g1_i1.p1 TRINITY_DN24678_c0_g1~~TRINITY_DN24678_c0_g1_i1.p1  ORF type:complete len:948 (+),score=267.79 TRINITY_DN24678_c0_g1_i1:33-2876(+)